MMILTRGRDGVAASKQQLPASLSYSRRSVTVHNE
jgi:hypothetical protein